MTKYVARLNGEIIGKRTSVSRTYSHAIAVQRVEEYARRQAYDYKVTKTDRSNFNYYTEIAEGRSPYQHTTDEVVRASGLIDGGFDAYAARLRDRAIASFEAGKANGHYEPFVAAWAGRLDLAHKAVSQHTGEWCRLIAIVEAEVA